MMSNGRKKDEFFCRTGNVHDTQRGPCERTDSMMLLIRYASREEWEIRFLKKDKIEARNDLKQVLKAKNEGADWEQIVDIAGFNTITYFHDAILFCIVRKKETALSLMQEVFGEFAQVLIVNNQRYFERQLKKNSFLAKVYQIDYKEVEKEGGIPVSARGKMEELEKEARARKRSKQKEYDERISEVKEELKKKPKVIDSEGRSALFYARDEKVQKVLMDNLVLDRRPISMDQKMGSKMRTQLMYFINHGHKEIAALLVFEGADLNLKNYDGNTALDYLISRNRLTDEPLREAMVNLQACCTAQTKYQVLPIVRRLIFAAGDTVSTVFTGSPIASNMNFCARGIVWMFPDVLRLIQQIKSMFLRDGNIWMIEQRPVKISRICNMPNQASSKVVGINKRVSGDTEAPQASNIAARAPQVPNGVQAPTSVAKQKNEVPLSEVERRLRKYII